MSTREKLYRALDELNEDQLRSVMRVIETLQAGVPKTEHKFDPTRYSGVLHLTEDPVVYQQRIRNEWP